MEFIFLIQARLGSTRLPKKVLKPIFKNLSIIEIIYKRVLLSKYANFNNIYILTSNNKSDDELVSFLDSKGIKYFRGDEYSVFDRFRLFLESKNIIQEYFFRICSDNPFLEPIFIDNMCEVAMKSNKKEDYISYVDFDRIAIIQKKYGLFCELIKTQTFLKYNSDSDNYNKENVTSFLYYKKNYNNFYIELPPVFLNKNFSLSVDTYDDYLKSKNIFSKLDKINFNYLELIEILNSVGNNQKIY